MVDGRTRPNNSARDGHNAQTAIVAGVSTPISDFASPTETISSARQWLNKESSYSVSNPASITQ